jgi:hypothetical protein
MAKPSDSEIAAVYTLGAESGLSEADVDRIAADVIGVLLGGRPASFLGQARSLKELRHIETRVREAARPVSVNTVTGEIGSEPAITDRQVDYIAELLAHRVRSGEGGGFFATGAFLIGEGDRTRIDMDAVRALTRRQASSLIDSLKGNY